MLKKVKLDEAIGMVLAHDVTKVIPGKFKGPSFRRGHVIRKEDIPELLQIGKEHIYIMELEAEIISYGAPVMPGAMFLYAMWEGIPILGAPAAVIYNPTTILDLILPRVLAEEKISREDIVELGHGGLCLNCEKCSFPICPFGK